jgi:hypothetical protein
MIRAAAGVQSRAERSHAPPSKRKKWGRVLPPVGLRTAVPLAAAPGLWALAAAAPAP